MDCDMFLRADITEVFEEYGQFDEYAVSVVKHDYKPKEVFKMEDKIVQQWLGWGYFQLFNGIALNKVYENLHEFYPNMSNNAGTDDYLFKQLFYQVISLNTHCLHLSPEKIYWDGIG